MEGRGGVIFDYVFRFLRVSLWAVFLLGLTSRVSAAEVGTVLISEVMWDGVEYVELYNSGDDDVALEEWSLYRQAEGRDEQEIVVFDEEVRLEPSGFLLIEKHEDASEAPGSIVASRLTLLNSGERLELRNKSAEVVDVVDSIDGWGAGENTADGVAMERVLDDDKVEVWYSSTGSLHGRAGTPGEENSEPAVNEPPEGAIDGITTAIVREDILWSAEDSSDAEDDKLTYEWDFGDGVTDEGVTVEHAYDEAGTFTVELVVSDGEHEVAIQHEVVVSMPTYSKQILVSELVPNPEGSDTEGEFLELYNSGAGSVDLSGWYLDDEAEAGSRPYEIPDGVTIDGGEYLSFRRTETKLALNNAGDAGRLLNPLEEEVAKLEYGDNVLEAESVSLINDEAVISTEITEGEKNVFEEREEEADDEDEHEDDEEETVFSAVGGEEVAGTSVETVTLDGIRELPVGALVKTSGVVSVPPGVLGKQVLYLAGSGVQVYWSKAQWPMIKLGDRVAVTGEVSAVRGETRIKLSQGDGVVVTSGGEPPAAHVVKTEEVDELREGWLVTIQGHVTETSGDIFYIDDGSKPAKVVIRDSTGIDKPAMKKGVAVTVTGVVSETTSGYRVLPRWQEDVRLGMVAGLTSFPATGRHDGFSQGHAWQVGLLVSGGLLWWGRRVREPLFWS